MKCKVTDCQGKALGDGTNLCLKHYIEAVPRKFRIKVKKV